ncbi:MAG: GAF domain-containing SpoIIE family protein phosphatase [Planctomycetota bacterium]
MTMFAPPTPPDETERLADLRALSILDTPPEQRFDEVVNLTKQVFNTPIAYIALIDADRQWFKSAAGLDADQTDRQTSFCGHTILRDDALVIEDTLAEPKWANHPMVTGEPHARFYAGYPLRSDQGRNIATLCIVDTQPRVFTDIDHQTLRHLAALAETQLNLVDLVSAQRQVLDARKALQEELAEAEAYVRSFLPDRAIRLNATERTDYQFIASSRLGGDLLGFQCIDRDHFGTFLLDVTGHGVGSSLLAVSAGNAIQSPNFPADRRDPAATLDALNQAFPMERHRNKFFTIWYGVYHRPSRTLTYATAGHHPALLQNPADPHTITRLGNPALMIGVVPHADYHNATHTLTPHDRLYLFSDGLFEVSNPEGQLLGLDGFTQLLQNHPTPTDPDDTRTAHILDQVRLYQQSPTFNDDASLLEIEFI